MAATPRKSWLPIPAKSHFSLNNIPFGIIETQFIGLRAGIAIGNHVLDLQAFASGDGFSALDIIQPHLSVFSSSSLNAFAALGRPVHRLVRQYLQEILAESTAYPHILRDNEALREAALIDLAKTKVKNHLPMAVGDYTDFYAGRHHAFNVGVLFRGADKALQPNYGHLPVGYHGRASSVVVSGTPIKRPLGQLSGPSPSSSSKTPTFAASRRLDIELELGAFLCKGNTLGQPIPITETEDHIFGYVLLNDWSARDIQAWEYVPLGPFLGKSFATSVSAWVVLADALDPYRARGLRNENELVGYLREEEEENVFDIGLEVDLITPGGNTTTITHTSSRHLLWSFNQMLAHHTINGCPMNVGDLLGSGTISGERAGSYGSLLEASANGTKDVGLAGMEFRHFLGDGDTIAIRGVCAGAEEGGLVGFGECVGTVVPAVAVDTLR